MLTRRDYIIKWGSYGAVSLLLTLLFSLTLRDLRVLGVTMFLPPLLVGVVASLEDTKSAVIYAIVVGVLCDLTIAGTFPCVYTLAFTAASLCCSILAKSVLQPGFLCSLALTTLTFVFVDVLNMLALRLKCHAEAGPMLLMMLCETAVSCILLVVCHPVLLHLHRKFTI
ncbi:MAG: hypothetical protein J5449_08560 [Oscillospiraceae bacterium]|nr:hypothetical protein [Oscillospiraceae bacterium]